MYLPSPESIPVDFGLMNLKSGLSDRGGCCEESYDEYENDYPDEGDNEAGNGKTSWRFENSYK